MSEAPDNHPFPYFKILVTRDLSAIRLAIEEMYKNKKKWENHTTRDAEYKEFTRNALLIADNAADKKPGSYEVDRTKVEAIVKKCLEHLRDYFMGQVSVYDKSVHPQQIDKCIEAAKRPPLSIDEKEARPFITQLIASEGIKITSVQPIAPKRMPQPVTQLRAECGDCEVRLFWKLPTTDCDRVKVVRSEGGNPKFHDHGEETTASQWNDTNVVPGKRYTYCVFSILASEALGSDQVSVVARGAVTDFKANVAGAKAALAWKLPDNVEEVLVFRSATPITQLVDDKGALKLLPAVGQIASLGLVTSFEDSKVIPGSTWHYAVAARHEGARYSPSESRSVTLPLAPTTVSGLKTEVVGTGHVYLSWQPVVGFGECAYRIMREEVGSSKAPEVIDTVKRNVYDDDEVCPGTTYRYSVLTLAGDVHGLSPVVGLPVTATGEVSALLVTAKEGLVTLSWKPPAGVKRVEIRRQAKTPPLPAERPGTSSPGVELFTAIEPDRYVDTRVVNGNAYGYRVSCVFLGADGKEIVTRGETATATPRRAPPAVLSPRIEVVGSGVRIGWDNPADTNVVVIRSEERPDYRPSAQRTLAQLDALGKRLASCGKTEVIDPAPDPENQPYYLIFSIDPHTAVFGGAVRILEITRATVDQEDGQAIVRWPWPEGCKEVRITRLGDGKALVVQRGAAKSDQAKATFPIATLGAGEHSFHLQCSTSAHDAGTIAGPGVTVTTRITKVERISWHLDRKKEPGWRRRESVEVVIVGERGFAQVDRLVLVGRVSRCPDNIDEGTFRHEWEPVSDLDGVIRFKAPEWKSSYGRVFCRLFVMPADAGRVIHPPAEECAL